MKRLALVAAGGIGGLILGLVVFFLVVKVVGALGLDDPLTGGGRGSISLSGMFGFLIVLTSVVGGAVLGYKKGDPSPDPTRLRESSDYFQWLGDHQDAKTRGSGGQQGGDGDQ